MNSSRVVGTDKQSLLSPTARASGQTQHTETMLFNDLINQRDLADIYRTFFQNTKIYSFFSAAHGVLYKTNHVVGHQPSINKYRRNVITSCILSVYDGIKLDVDSNENRRKYKNSSKPNTTQLNDNCANEEFRRKI